MSFLQGKLGKTLGVEATETAATLGQVALAAAPAAAAMVALEIVSGVLMKNFQKIGEAFSKMFSAIGKAAKRDQETQSRNFELAQQRITADINEIVKKPFEILEKAAQTIYDAWDSNLRLINQTQGYNKADLQDLMSAFAQRLRDEGLSSVVAGTDVVSALTKVLESGLSGKIAEEFAYQAVKLNAAIPTQDFFGFAATYSSIAANAVKDGKSQSEAITEANRSLYEFSNNVLYASRELAGGFTTGLRDAQTLYEESVKIVQASRTGDINKVSGVLTSVSAIVGAIAPDLASSITDAVYKAATGGNSSDIVALRSLAGINASNTEFLRALATDPQKVFSNLFENLARMFNDSSDAYMEKAEAYGSLFGLSAEAFQRVDFNYLAKAISEMDINSASLNKNLALLESGQSTQTAEQMKIAQINQYMIEEGLAYVLDNEAARAIQQHMWDEQRDRALMEAEYGVNLVGDTKSALLDIANAVSNILNLLNPANWFKRINNAIESKNEFKALEQDVQQILELGKVGQGNQRDLYNLVTRNADLKLTQSLVEMLGGTSAYEDVNSRRLSRNKFFNSINAISLNSSMMGRPILYQTGSAADWISGVSSAYSGASSLTAANSPTSRYSWGTVGKSENTIVSGMLSALNSSGTGRVASNLSNIVKSSSTVVSNVVSRMLDTIDEYAGKGKTYEDWMKSGRFRSEEAFESALTDAGYSEAELKRYFENKETEAGMQQKIEDAELEKRFRESGIKYWDETFPSYQEALTLQLTENFDKIHQWNETYLASFLDHTSYFKQAFVEEAFKGMWIADAFTPMFKAMQSWWKTYSDYYIEHKIYVNEGSGSQRGTLLTSRLQAVQNAEKGERGDVINALANYLTANSWDLKDFQDPQIQANALLSQILIVLNAIMKQNSQVSAGDIPDSLAKKLLMGLI